MTSSLPAGAADLQAELYDLKSASSVPKFHFSSHDHSTIPSSQANPKLTREIVFTNDKNEKVVREWIQFASVSEDSPLMSYEMQHSQSHIHLMVTRKEVPQTDSSQSNPASSQYTVEIQEQSGTTKPETFPIVPDLLLPPMLVHAMQSHWELWQQGKTWECKLLVPDLLQTVTMKIFPESSAENQPKNKQITETKTLRLKMVPASIFIKVFVSPLYFEFDLQTHQILRAEGRTLLLNEKGEPLIARTEFAPQ
jgi:hypothetical protein